MNLSRKSEIIQTEKNFKQIEQQIKENEDKIGVLKEDLNTEKETLNKKMDDTSSNIEKIKEDIDNTKTSIDDMKKEIENIDLSADKVNLSGVTGITSNNVKGAIQELFQFADNGKKLVSNVIGSPLSATDTFSSMQSKIQTLKNDMASNLSSKGQSTNSQESLNSLISKIVNINSSDVKVAYGVYKFPESTRIYQNTDYEIFISGFDFTPKFIFLTSADNITSLYNSDTLIIIVKDEKTWDGNNNLSFVRSSYDSKGRFYTNLSKANISKGYATLKFSTSNHSGSVSVDDTPLAWFAFDRIL